MNHLKFYFFIFLLIFANISPRHLKADNEQLKTFVRTVSAGIDDASESSAGAMTLDGQFLWLGGSTSGKLRAIRFPLDEEHKIQRFTPRNPKSTYSQANKERLNRLLENKMIHPKFEDRIQHVLSEPFIFPNDIIDKLKKDEIVWENYQQFSDSYKRIRIAYIEAARKRPEEFEKRLNNFISKTKENKLIAGFGGIDKFY